MFFSSGVRVSVNPFLLSSGEPLYKEWRDAKLNDYPKTPDQLSIDIKNGELTAAECQSIVEQCAKSNLAIYRLANPEQGDKVFVRDFGQKLGLNRLDGNLCADHDSITSLQVMDAGRHAGYIPYTNRRLSWHTDGYYNKPDQRTRSFIIHCAQPAAEGGENLVLDHEMAYLQMRDENPDYIKAFMRESAMTIPPNIENGVEIRGEQSGPVFSVDVGGHLHMRYSARTRNIEWYNDELTREAVDYLNSLLDVNNPYVFSYRLRAGEGIICNNVLHCRTGFEDSGQNSRLLYRARYFDRVKDV
jgi:Taurine catabolism dioxygenase TauD, TfdA family